MGGVATCQAGRECGPPVGRVLGALRARVRPPAAAEQGEWPQLVGLGGVSCRVCVCVCVCVCL